MRLADYSPLSPSRFASFVGHAEQVSAIVARAESDAQLEQLSASDEAVLEGDHLGAEDPFALTILQGSHVGAGFHQGVWRA